MSLSNLVEKLTGFEPSGFPFITIYLNAGANENGRDAYGAWLRNELSGSAGNFKEESPEAESYNRDVERILNFIDTQVEPSANGIAIFACFAADEFFETAQIEVPFPNNRFFVFDRPHVFPFVRAIEQNPRYAVLWADTNKADIYIYGGERSIDAETDTDAQVEHIENVVTQRSQAGGWSQQRFQRRLENFHLQHAKETVDVLEKLMRNAKIGHLILCGDEATIMPILRPQLPKALDEAVIGTLNMSQYDSEDEIHEATLALMKEYDAKKDEEAIERAIGAAKAAAQLGTIGVEDTLAALSNGQVEELVISANFNDIEYSPKKVKKVLKAYAPGDDNSASDVLPDAKQPRQIADELIIRALNTAAKIRFIEQSELLEETHGVAAVLRYNINSTANG
jgi:peptide subunit release factor 1 (eRF1)